MNRFVLCAVAIASLCTTSAHAGEINAPIKVAVRYDDINVNKSSGARELLSRLERASKTVCGYAPDIRDLKAWQGFKTCEKTALDGAIASLPFDLMARIDANKDSESVAQR